MLSPLLSVDPHDEGVAIRVRHCLLVLPVPMAREYAEAILAAARTAGPDSAAQLPNATVLGQDGKPTKIEL